MKQFLNVYPINRAICDKWLKQNRKWISVCACYILLFELDWRLENWIISRRWDSDSAFVSAAIKMFFVWHSFYEQEHFVSVLLIWLFFLNFCFLILSSEFWIKLIWFFQMFSTIATFLSSTCFQLMSP